MRGSLSTRKYCQLTSEYTDQYVTDPKNHSSAKFTFSINKLSISFYSQALQYSCISRARSQCLGWPARERLGSHSDFCTNTDFGGSVPAPRSHH